MNENSKATKRREWVKNAAIIFLTIMLILTFFSNTIMNYSLPEVATEYVQSGTITAKVRGTGNLEATDPYNVVINESRKIESVNVKNGDTVEKDSVLFYLEDVESEELKAAEEELKTAKKELEDLRLAYLTGLFTGDITSDVISKIESGKVGTLSSFQTKLAEIDGRLIAAKNRLSSVTTNQQNTQDILNNLKGQQNLNEATVVDTSGEKKAVNSATTNVSNAEAEISRIKGEITNIQTKIDDAEKLLGTSADDGKENVGGIQEYQEKVDNAKQTLTEKIKGKNDAEKSLAEKQANLDEAMASGVQADIDKAQLEYNQVKEHIYDKAVKELADAEAAVSMAQEMWSKQSALLSEYSYNVAALDSLKNSLTEAEKNLKNANAVLSSAQEALSNKEADAANAGNKGDLKKQIVQAETNKTDIDTQITNIEAEIKKIEDEKGEFLKTLTEELNLSSKNTQIAVKESEIEEKEAEIEKIREKSVGASVTAPVTGTITSINHVAGESTKPEEVLAVIQPEGKGFTLSFSATTEQAKKLSVGDIAELQNAWYYDEVKATLVSIKPDKEDPAQKKLLTFNVEGDVQAGQSLSLAVGQKSANYELVVPNSAIREDNNGKFILIVESKSSPLGNRYIATRIDVEVLASDDTHTAISAGLYGYEYVITTATKPVEAGKQVRLTD